MRRLKRWLKAGREIRILTARANVPEFVPFVEHWLMEQGLPCLPVTSEKDFGCLRFWQDHCARVQHNTGELVDQFRMMGLHGGMEFDEGVSAKEKQQLKKRARQRLWREFRVGGLGRRNGKRLSGVQSLADTEWRLYDGWVAVDLDGTLAEYHAWEGPEHIGEPVPAMLERIRMWQAHHIRVRIFTARASIPEYVPFVRAWLRENGLGELPITHRIDFDMLQLWDDRCVHVETNTGLIADQWRDHPVPCGARSG